MYFPIISEADLMTVRYYKKYSTDSVIRQRMQVIDMRCRKIGAGLTSLTVGVHPNSVTRWVKLYISGGVERLLQVDRYRPQSDLLTFKEEIRQDFDRNPPKSIGQARKRIQELTGLDRSIKQVRLFLKNILNFKWRKYRRTSGGKRSIKELKALQEEFLANQLFPLLAKARRGGCELFFVDGVHPVQGFHQGHVWSEKPVVIRTSSGRQRVNILGALNALKPEMYSIAEEKYINSGTVCELIKFLRDEHPRKQLFLILDNARYQRCEFVTRYAKRKNVNLVFLPPYSPNLNIIERLWKFMKSKVLAGKYHASKQEFKDAVNGFIDDFNEGLFDSEVQSLLTTNFQILEEPTKITSGAPL